jgi:gas vesicle protein
MATMLDDTMATAKNLMGSAKEGTEQAASSARSTVMDGVHAITSVAAMLRSLDSNDALGWVGLARRRSPFVSMAIFGAGFAAGAGAGMLLAPTSGADLRRNLMKGLMGLWGDAKDVAEKAETKVEKIEDKAEDLAGKAKDAVKKAERNVEAKVADGVKTLEDSVKTRAAAAVSTVKDAAHDAKSVMSAATDPAHDSAEISKPAARGAGAGHRPS